jgi:hypothetical protein
MSKEKLEVHFASCIAALSEDGKNINIHALWELFWPAIEMYKDEQLELNECDCRYDDRG